MNFTRRQPDSIVLDLNIRSMEEERSFKKYKCSFGKVKAPSIPFDEILKEGTGPAGETMISRDERQEKAI